MNSVDKTDWALERNSFIAHALRIKSGWTRWDFNRAFGWGRFAYWDKHRWSWAAKWVYLLTDHLARTLYTYKCIICVAMDRRRNMYADGDIVEVAHWGFRSWTSMEFYGTAFDWWILAVGAGWRDWHYDVYETSSA